MGVLRVKGQLAWAPQKPGRCYRLDSGLTTQPVAPFRKSVYNVVAGLKERIMYLDEAGTKRPPCLRSASELLLKSQEVAKAVEVPSPLTMAAYVATRPGRTRKLYEAALVRFNTLPVDLRREAQTSLFTKWEKTVHSKRQVPRIINPRSPLYNIMLGRYLHPIEPLIFDALRQCTGQNEPAVAKGLTMEERGAIVAKHFADGYVGVGLDASRFDQSISTELLKLEHQVYTSIYPYKSLKRLLDLQLDNRGVCRVGDVELRLRYGAIRCSGDVNTSLGNCIISVLLASQFLQESGLTGKVLCDGDDLVVFVLRRDLSKLQNAGLADWYLRWGLRMKIEAPAFVPEELEFCQARPIWTPRGYVMVRDVRKALNCDYVGFDLCKRDDYFRVLMRSVGLCGLSMAAGIPILQEWYQFGVRHGSTGRIAAEDFRSSGLHFQARIQRRAGSTSKPVPVHPETRCSFQKAFGIHVSSQLVTEEYIRSSQFGGRNDINYIDYQADLPPSIQKYLISDTHRHLLNG